MTKEKKTEKAETPKSKKKKLSNITSRLTSDAAISGYGLIFWIFCAYVTVSLISFCFTGSDDQSFIQNSVSNDSLNIKNEVANWGGYTGAILSDFIINRMFGIPCVFALIFCHLLCIRTFSKWRMCSLRKAFWHAAFLTIWASIFFGFFFMSYTDDNFLFLGGEHGRIISLWLEAHLGWFGTSLIIISTFAFYCKLAFPNAVNNAWSKITSLFGKKQTECENSTNSLQTAETAEISNSEANESNDETAEKNTDLNESNDETENDETEIEIVSKTPEEEQEKNNDSEVNWNINPTEKTASKKQGGEVQFIIDTPPAEEQNDSEEDNSSNETMTLQIEETAEEEAFDPEKMEPYDPTKDLEFYRKPPLDLFKKYDNIDQEIDYDEQEKNKNRIVEVLRSFGVEITSIKATIGPTVTLYEVTPAPGIKISKIKNLGDDIALSIAAKGIRIIAPIPGKGTIGIEVPNSKPRMVPMGDIIGSKKFQESKFELPIALGKTITNEVYMVDLCKMPHVLVAGATGQGKSVGLNAIITSLLYKKHPAELKFVMVDPKMVEFSMYAPIVKHFLAKMPDAQDAIITDVSKVVQTLNSLCIEMDARYELLKDANVRQIIEYNNKFISRKLNPNNGHKYLPYIVVVIDEFADLIMQVGKEVETPIARIAQKARAVGIHMILATQRPSANIITGVIRANFPARFAFKVSTGLESRVILDTGGAEQLIGRGDMLISQGNDFERVQCAFVDTPEVESITKYIQEQQGYPTAFILPEYVDENGGGEEKSVDLSKRDPMFEKVAEFVIMNQQGSTSMIQRKFCIGFNRAGRIMDQLEAAKIVGPAEGGKPRQVLVMDLTHLETILGQL